jgi:hypothetical protein
MSRVSSPTDKAMYVFSESFETGAKYQFPVFSFISNLNTELTEAFSTGTSLREPVNIAI